jgi:type III secretion protein L
MEDSVSPAQGRIVRAAEGSSWACLRSNGEAPTEQRAQLPEARVVCRERLEAAQQAQRLIEQAKQTAAEIVEQARRQREQSLESAHREARDHAAADLAAAWLTLRDREVRADEATLQRSLELAQLLAERLLQETLRLHPDAVMKLAREAVGQFWQARSVTIHAHPLDAEQIRSRLSELSVKAEAVAVIQDGSLGRGSLRVVSDLGSLDAHLAPQLERLVESLRRAMAKG